MRREGTVRTAGLGTGEPGVARGQQDVLEPPAPGAVLAETGGWAPYQLQHPGAVLPWAVVVAAVEPQRAGSHPEPVAARTGQARAPRGQERVVPAHGRLLLPLLQAGTPVAVAVAVPVFRATPSGQEPLGITAWSW
jgi:hypothetical protein